MAWSIALASGWGVQAAYGEEREDRQAVSPRAETTSAAYGEADACSAHAVGTAIPDGLDARMAARAAEAGNGTTPGLGNVWGVLSVSERQARAIAAGEGAIERASTAASGRGPARAIPDDPLAPPAAPANDGATTPSRQVQQRALSTLALHAVRAMGSDTARVIGLDAIEPPVDLDVGALRLAASHTTAPSAPGAGTQRRGLRPADPVSLRPPRQLASAYDDLIEEVAREHAVAPHLVRAVIKVESNFEPNARSPKGAIGLMQVMPATGRRFGASDLKDPRTNLGAGTRYLRWLLNRFDQDLTLAVAAYNAGEGAVEKYGRQVPPYPETRNYVRKVLAHLGMPGVDAGGAAAADPASDSATAPAAGSRTESRLATMARAPSGENARRIAGADRAAASRKPDAALSRLSGWFGTILTSGSSTSRARSGGEGLQQATWRDAGEDNRWPEEQRNDRVSADRDETSRGRRDGGAAAPSYDVDWPVSGPQGTGSREPV